MVRIKTVNRLLAYGCVLLGFSAVVEHLERYHLIGFVCLACFALFCEHRRVVDIPRWLLNGISLGMLCLAVVRITPEYLIEPILDALVILAAVKLLEEKQIRDMMQIYLICLFLLVGSSLVSLSISFLPILCLFLMLVTIALILLSYFAHDPEMTLRKTDLGKIVLQSLLMFSLSLPLSVLLFVILPRTAFPFLTFLNQAGSARSGFTDTIALGQVAAIQEDSAAIFRAEMEPLDDNRLFWKGVVLDRFDGTRWTSTPAASKEEFAHADTGGGQTLVQTIYLEPYGNKYLFALDKPVAFAVHRNSHSRKRITPFKTIISERIRYTATSLITDRFPPTRMDRERYLALPTDFAPEMRKLVKDLVAQKPPDERIKTLFAFLRRGIYAYSLEDLPVSDTPLETFLFVNKRGNCEYFASSLAVMLRMAGIPARLIGGYKGGLYNNAGKYYLVTQRNAHVWVEAHLTDAGWLRLDPTPPAVTVASSSAAGRVLLQLRLLFDTFNYYWYKVIIDYDFTRQVEIVNAVRERIARPNLKFGVEEVASREMLLIPGILLAVFLLLWALFANPKSREERIIARFLQRMAAHGYEKHAHEGLEEFVQRIDRKDLQGRAQAFVDDFEEVYYHDRPFTRETLERLRLRLRAL